MIVHVSEPIGPDQTAVVIGDGFGETPSAFLDRLPDDPPGDPDAVPPRVVARPTTPVEVIQPSDTSLKFVVPAGQRPGVYELTVRAATGTTAHRLVNAPQIWWVQGDLGPAATPGGELRLFGRCLGGGQKAWVDLTGPRRVRLQATAGTWSARVVLPRDLPPGDYRVRCHAGWGGPWAWSAPVELAVRRPEPWPTTVYNVRDHGADGTGARDDTAAIQACLDAAGAAGGGVVFLPRGRYLLTAGLSLPVRTVLRGEGEALTCLFWPDADNPPPALLAGTHHFAIEQLTLYCTRHQHIITGEQGTAEAGHVRLDHVRVRADAYRGHLRPEEVDERFRASLKFSTGGGDTVRLGGENVQITDCDFYGSGRAIYLSRVRGGRVERNRFANGRWGWYCLSGSDGLIFADNQIVGADLMATGGGLNCLDGSSFSQNVYYARNSLSTMHGWDREAMTSDAGGGLYYGPIATVDGAVITLPVEPQPGRRDWTGAGVFVFAGKGWGQYRRVAAIQGATLTLDRPFDIAPDATSLIGVTMLQRHYLILANTFADAGIAVQFYGTSIDHVVAGNRCERAGGYQAIGKPYGGYDKPPEQNPCHQPSWYCQFLDNTIAEGAIYRSGANNAILSGESVIGIFGWPLKADWPWPYNVGAIVRGNRLENGARVSIGGSGHAAPSVRDVVVEHNAIASADEGVRLDRATTGVALRANTFERVRQPIAGEGVAQASIPASQRAAALECQARTALAELGVDPSGGPGVQAALAALRAAAPEQIPAAETAVVAAVLGAVAGAGRALPWRLAGDLLGLDLAVARESTLPARLQAGEGGEATLLLTVTTRRASDGWTATVEPELPAGWTARGSAPAELAAGAGAVRLDLTLPEGAWGRFELPVALTLNLGGGARLTTRTRLTVGAGYLTEYLAIGPFPNRSGRPLDLGLHPPDDGIDLTAAYATPGGERRWEPLRVRDWVDLNAHYSTKEPGVAYLTACVEAAGATPATLRIGSSGGVAVVHNGRPVCSIDSARRPAPDQDRVSLNLTAGDNVLLFKVCTASDTWRFIAELTPPTEGFAAPVRPVPAADFAGRPCYAPPPARPATVPGELRFTAGVSWQLVHADDFPGQEVGPRWRAYHGTWTAADGMVAARGDKAFLAYLEPLPAPVRIEYDARVTGDRGSDLSAFWLTDPGNYASGYLLGFGSNGNSVCKLLIDGGEVKTSDRPLVEPGRWHHVIAQILADGRVQLIVDEQMAIDHAGPPPGSPKQVGLWAWGGDALFRAVRIYAGSAPR